MEGRWLKNADIYLNDYIRFLVNHAHEGTQYSSFTLWATKEFHAVTGKADIPAFLPKAKALYADFEREHGTEIGLFWSIDGYDAMEFSLSGSPDGAPIKGIRPTLNSYMYGAAKAIDAFSRLSGESSSEYGEKAEKISADIKNILWRDGFFKALHPRDGDFKKVPTMETADIPRELIGYIPFVFSIPGGRYDVFSLLEDRSVFLAKEGLTTVDRGFPGFLSPSRHECLWNGYVWPFATSQTLTALLQTLRDSEDCRKQYKNMFWRLLNQYAKQHYLEEHGRRVMWIDESGTPDTHCWWSRKVLKENGWPKDKGGFERGKDYNHSTFCDFVISALSGAEYKNDALSFDPVIPDNMEYFSIDDLYIQGNRYRIVFDRTGNKYGKMGTFIYKNVDIVYSHM